jgi:hypothetical protein
MAIALSSAEREAFVARLADPDAVRRDPFGLARDLCAVVNAHGGAAEEFPTDVQELVIRAREHRKAFGPAAAIIDGLVRERGLFPYLEGVPLGAADRIAYEMHRPFDLDDSTVFHRLQAHVYHLLLNGANVAVSAPTSFGKSLVIDAVIAEGRHARVAIIVPTIALIDETRRRLAHRFGTQYKIVTHADQEPAERTIYVLTPERVPQAIGIEEVTFFAIDEFYKLDPRLEPDRSEALNEALYRLHRRRAQFYLLGPNIDRIPAAFTTGYECTFVSTSFATVATEIVRVVAVPGQEQDHLVRLVGERTALSEPMLVYCRSPESARTVARALARALQRPVRGPLVPAAAWVGEAYHREWSFVEALAVGIGLHHGRMPRALQQFVTSEFNAGRLDVLVCTSTLIEGVNTTAKNVVIYDHAVGQRPLDYFTFHNIKGRAGRMMRHFVGRVYLFRDGPANDTLEVDIPVATQAASASDALLLQLDDEDLSDTARGRLDRYFDQELLPTWVLKENRGIDPDAQLRLAAHLRDNAQALWPQLKWRTPTPMRDELAAVCDLLWEFLLPERQRPRGALSSAQLRLRVARFAAEQDVRRLIDAELENQSARGVERDPDVAVEDTLDFLRNWATYHFPRLLMALSRIQEAVFSELQLPPGDYSALATQCENYFLPHGIAALDEYGIPLQVGRRLIEPLGGAEAVQRLDEALARLRTLKLDSVPLTRFERDLVERARQQL